MVFIHNGKVVEKRPFSLFYMAKTVSDYVIFFGSSFLSNEPLPDQVRAFRSRNDPRSVYRPFSNVLGMDTSSLVGGSSNSNNNGGVGTATGRRTVYRTVPQAPLSGACGGGG